MNNMGPAGGPSLAPTSAEATGEAFIAHGTVPTSCSCSYHWPSSCYSPEMQTNRGEQVRLNRSRRGLSLFALAQWLPLLLFAPLWLTLDLRMAKAENRVINIKVGALLEESDHEQANMFIRTIKMINERKDQTIKRLLSIQGSRQYGRQLGTSLQNNDNAKLTSLPTETGSASRIRSRQATEPGAHRRAEEKGLLFRRTINWSQYGYNNDSQASANLQPNPDPNPNDDDYDHDHDHDHDLMVQVKLEPMIEFILDRNSAFEADGKVCQLIESGVHALIGPLDGSSVEHVQSICDNMEIPYFELRPYLGSPAESPLSSSASASSSSAPSSSSTSSSTSSLQSSSSSSLFQPAVPSNEAMKRPLVPASDPIPGLVNQQTGSRNSIVEDLTLNLHPPAHLLTSAYIDLIYAWNWTSFAIVYEEGNSMIKLQDLFRESSGTWTSKWQIKLFQFESSSLKAKPTATKPEEASDGANLAPSLESNFNLSSSNPEHPQQQRQQSQTRPGKVKGLTFRDIFWRIKLGGEQNILLDVKTENLFEALKQAQQVGCMTERFSYLITSLDLHTLDLEDFKYSRTRITGFSIINVVRSSSNSLDSPPVNPSQATSWSSQNNMQQFRGLDGKSSINKLEEDNDEPMRMRKGKRLPAHHDVHQAEPIDDKYLERLGVHVSGRSSDLSRSASGNSGHHEYSDSYDRDRNGHTGKYKAANKFNKVSPSVTLERSGSFMDPPQDAYNRDWFRREMLQSSPASMRLLPSVDRDKELRLFEFFIEQQENNLARVKLSTAAAILHDSIILLLRGLHELDPAGHLLAGAAFMGSQNDTRDPMQLEQPIVCSLNSKPWLHGSSLVNYMRQANFRALTGNVAFDQRGLRSQFKLDMLGMAPDIGLVKVGEWHSQYDWRQHHQSLMAGSDDSSTAPQQQSPTANYDELSKFYDSELKRYERLLAAGTKVRVPYAKPIWRQSLAQRLGLDTLQDDRKQRHRSRLLLEQYNGPALMVNEIIFERLYREQADQVDTLIVTTKLSQPYFMLKETPNKLEGNDQYEGFAVDLVHELSKLINFKYRWREVADKKYGSKEVLPNGTVVWNGMIGELLRGQADLAIVDLTITAQREEAVDFTLPFMNTGISILFKKPTTKVTTLFSFLSPFSSDVWAYVLAAYCGISANLFLVGHLSPYEWADPHPCRHSLSLDDGQDSANDNSNNNHHQTTANSNSLDSSSAVTNGNNINNNNHLHHHTTVKLLENQFSLLNSFWFTIGSLMQQGSDLTPRSMSTRTIAGIWYFFTLIMISSYTANLAAFLTVEKVVYPIENVRDLSQQTEIKYGCVESGSTCTFFHDSQIDTYKRITETMRRFNTYVRSNDEGQKRVEEGKFAYFMESASIEYIVERNCNLTQIGGLLDSKGYGLATSKRSRLKRPYRTLLSEGILHLQETGMLHVLKNRWWKERRGGGTCTDDGKGGGVTELSLANVGGVFVVLLGGLGISFLVAIAEFMWRARRGGSTRDRICEEMMNDLKFALACKSSTKPISIERQQSRSTKRQLLRQQSASLSASGHLKWAGKQIADRQVGVSAAELGQEPRQSHHERRAASLLKQQQLSTTSLYDDGADDDHDDDDGGVGVDDVGHGFYADQDEEDQVEVEEEEEGEEEEEEEEEDDDDDDDDGHQDDYGEDRDRGEAAGNRFAFATSSKAHKKSAANGLLVPTSVLEDKNQPTNHHHHHHHHAHHHQDRKKTKQQQQQANRGVKECDPILLHAMLTMLTQQQQPAPHTFAGDAGAQQVPQSVLPSNPSIHHRLQQQPPHTFATGSPNELLMVHEQQKQNSRLSKRRLLFAQRTIDMADDALP